jgi:hypothetical protein
MTIKDLVAKRHESFNKLLAARKALIAKLTPGQAAEFYYDEDRGLIGFHKVPKKAASAFKAWYDLKRAHDEIHAEHVRMDEERRQLEVSNVYDIFTGKKVA